MYKSTGMGILKIADVMHISNVLVSRWLRQFPTPPPIEARMERCVTRHQALLTANLYILAQRIRGESFPRFLTQWETPKLSGSRPVLSARDRMIRAHHTLRSAEYYATTEIAPCLMDPKFVHVPHRRYDDPYAWTTTSLDRVKLPRGDQECLSTA